jgi:hypothetical protein
VTRETEVADFLRSDATLVALCPGGIYPDAWLPDPEGLTSTQLTKVWANGVFNPTVVIRQRAPVPTGDLQSTRTQRTSTSQAIEAWAYATDAATVEAMLQHIYRLLMGKRLTAAFSTTWIGSGVGIVQAPELPPGTLVGMESYRYVAIRRAVTV